MTNFLGPASLALLALAGLVKANSALAWVPFDLTVIAAVLVAAFAVSARVHQRRRGSGLKVVVVLWAIFLLGVVQASMVGYSESKVYTLFTITLLCALAPSYLLVTQQQREVFLQMLLAISVLSSVQGLFFSTPVTAEAQRLTFENADTIVTAQLSGAGALVALLFALRPDARPKYRVTLLTVAALLVYTLLAAGSRGPFGAFVVALAVTLMLSACYQKYRGRALIGGAVVLILALRRAVEEGSAGAERIFAAITTGEVDRNRALLWGTARRFAEANPFGIGWGGFEPFSFSPYPHNILLEVAAEAGWLPLIALMSALAIAGVRLKRGAVTVDVACMFALFIFGVMGAMVSSDINGVRLMWIAASVGWGLTKHQVRKDVTPSRTRYVANPAGSPAPPVS